MINVKESFRRVILLQATRPVLSNSCSRSGTSVTQSVARYRNCCNRNTDHARGSDYSDRTSRGLGSSSCVTTPFSKFVQLEVLLGLKLNELLYALVGRTTGLRLRVNEKTICFPYLVSVTVNLVRSLIFWSKYKRSCSCSMSNGHTLLHCIHWYMNHVYFSLMSHSNILRMD